MTGDIFVVDGIGIISTAISDYHSDLRVWESQCSRILDSFTTKTSRVATNLSKDNIKEYTYWYRKLPSGGLESCGKERPDIESMYPPKPERPITFEYRSVNYKHIIISDADFENNTELFGIDCFIFPYSALIPPGSSFVRMEAECA